MSRRAGRRPVSLVALLGVLVAIGPLVPAHAAGPRPADDPVIVPAGDVGTTAIRFREEWAVDPAPDPVVGSFDAAQVEFMGLEVKAGGSYDVTAFDGQQSGEVELTVPGTLAPGTYDTSTSTPGDTGFFFHGHLGYAGYGTGSFTVVRVTYDDAGQVVSFLATYDEVLDDPLGASHVVGVVAWADPGTVPQVVQLSGALGGLSASGTARLGGTLLSTGAPGGSLTVLRVSHGLVAALPDVTVGEDGTFALSDRPPCAGGATYVLRAADSDEVLGDTLAVSIPLVRCSTAGGGAAGPRPAHRSRQHAGTAHLHRVGRR